MRRIHVFPLPHSMKRTALQEVMTASGDRFFRNERGSVAIMFALTTLVVFTVVGSAVDSAAR